MPSVQQALGQARATSNQTCKRARYTGRDYSLAPNRLCVWGLDPVERETAAAMKVGGGEKG